MPNDSLAAAEVIGGITPIYDINKTYLENVKEGPLFDKDIPERLWQDENLWTDFMGYRVASPLGVPAGPLLTSRWTTLAARLGFDVVTYKTIRSQAYSGHPLPNIVFVAPHETQPQAAEKVPTPRSMDALSITNSFGNPSMPPVFLLEDIAAAKQSLKKGQLLIVSVFGSTDFGQDLYEDFARITLFAKEAGAQVIEANFSCPNVSSREGGLYTDPENSYRLASCIVKAAAPLPVLIKMGAFPCKETLQCVLTALARAGVQGVCGINTLPMRIIEADGKPALGATREKGGVCGNMIRQEALAFVRNARHIIDKERLDLALAGCGGIVRPEHFDEFLKAGASIVMSATGMMWNPYLAMEWHQNKWR